MFRDDRDLDDILDQILDGLEDDEDFLDLLEILVSDERSDR